LTAADTQNGDQDYHVQAGVSYLVTGAAQTSRAMTLLAKRNGQWIVIDGGLDPQANWTTCEK
jgi:hypothetical protein